MARFNRSKSPNSSNEFPLLRALGFTTIDIDADGNCLFSALSDQIYGHPGKAFNIRIAVVKYLREHADEFKPFINYDGERRSPRACTRGRFSSASPTPGDIEDKVVAAWERYLTSMSKWGTWGDNMTIRAFACAFNRNVRVYQREGERDILADDERHSMVRIAYHDWHHYSSISTINRSSDFPKSQANVKIQRSDKVENWMDDSTPSPRKLNGTLPFKVMIESFAYDIPKKSSSVNSSFTASPSTSPSSPSSDSSIVQDFDSTDEKSLKAPVGRRRLLTRKDLNKPIIRAASPSSVYSSQSIGSNKRVLDDDSDDELSRGSKRVRQSIPTKDIPYLSLSELDTAFIGVPTLHI